MGLLLRVTVNFPLLPACDNAWWSLCGCALCCSVLVAPFFVLIVPVVSLVLPVEGCPSPGSGVEL